MATVPLNKLSEEMLSQVDKFLDDEKSIPTRTGLQLSVGMTAELYKSHNLLIEKINEQNGRVSNLEKNSILLWAKANPKTSIFIAVAVFVVQSSINWAGLRKPLLHSIAKMAGFDVPLDSIP